MAYATVEELRDFMNKEGAEDDVLLSAILDGATKSIDRAVGKELPGLDYFDAPDAASARTYAGSGKGYQRIDRCIAITLVEVKASYTATDYVEWAADDWLAYQGSYKFPVFGTLPYTAIMADPNGDYSVFTRGYQGPTVRVTARWGYSATPPDDVHLACMMQAARWYKRGQSAMSDTMASGELGMLLYRQSLDPDIKRILVDGRYIETVWEGF